MEPYLCALTPNRWGERGVAFPLALMALMVFAALSAAILTIGGSEVQIAGNLLRDTQARFMAEAGLEDAFNYYRTDTSRLPASNAAYSTTVTTLYCVATSYLSCPSNVTTLTGPGTSLTGYGTYTVTAQTVGPYTVLVTSTGASATGSASKVLRVPITIGFTSNDAIRTKGDLEVNGASPKVTGTCGSAHTNEDFDTSGNANPTFQQGVTATGSADSPGTGSKPKKTIPEIRASDFLSASLSANANETFQMRTDGTVLQGNNATPVFTYQPANPPSQPQAVDTYRGWKWDAKQSRWQLAASTNPERGTYHFQQDVTLQNVTAPSGGVTILTTGNIAASGNLSLTPHLTDTLVVADKDIQFGGNSGSTAQGLIAAHEQIDLAGSVTITGYVLAEDATSTDTTPPDAANVSVSQISGGVTVRYDCDGSPPIKGPIRFLAWGM